MTNCIRDQKTGNCDMGDGLLHGGNAHENRTSGANSGVQLGDTFGDLMNDALSMALELIHEDWACERALVEGSFFFGV
ncbi:hypothetical protein GOBAR_AA38773 [Gossypium barbadense]|uniref:Uncharacterized protein n=1 Tax=Gossypium barbadense TaxID=3634 RepID=A0A2P5VSX5_GOSBA|nr:hypothetical protein GOBAR_AA38773 [Gossypium barbadense]